METKTPMQIARLARALRNVPLLAAAGLVIAFWTTGAQAQNAAQRAALARLSKAHAKAQDSSVEANSIRLDQPGGLAFDAAGNLYLADTDNNIIREVNLAGVVSTAAGNGEQGYGGDGGPATDALLDTPVGVAVDHAGNIYIGDTHNNCIREVVASTGNIVTIAGTGVAGFSGDGGAAASALLSQPTAVAVDSTGNVYIADTGNHRIREISGVTINTVAGNGEQFYSGDGGPATAAGLDSPNGVAVDAAFNLYIGDTHNQRVRMVTFSTGTISTLAGTGDKTFTADGSATAAALARPQGVAVDSSGTVYVADSDNNRIRSISGGTVTTLAGDGAEGFNGDSGASTGVTLDSPSAVAVAGTSLVFSDTGNNLVRDLNAGTINAIAGQPSATDESLIVGGPLSSVYGSGTLSATFSNNGNAGTGLVTFYDGLGASQAAFGSGSLSGNTATVSTSLLSAGTHSITASYAGDTQNPAIVSGVYVLSVTPAPLTAAANSVQLLYGQAIPALTGTLTGLLTQDTGNVTAIFSTAATITSAPGTYPISVALAGSAAGNYTVALGAGSGAIVISAAPTTTTLTASNLTPSSGTTVTLSATVASTTSGTPTGSVNFFNGTAQLNTAAVPLSGGVASLSVDTLPIGALSLTAVYSGDTDFITSTSPIVTATVTSPGFSIAASPIAQSVLPGHSVQYTITVTPGNSVFVYPVSLSVSGLPAGVTAAFEPNSIATGAGVSTTVLTLTASNLAALPKSKPFFGGLESSAALALLLLPLLFGKRTRLAAARLSRTGRLLIALLALAAACAITGCSGGYFGHSPQSYTVTVTAVSGPASHSTNVTLTVE